LDDDGSRIYAERRGCEGAERRSARERQRRDPLD